ncbi:MAG TPA: HIT domain-containing protein [Anaerolineae bacterium]|nr:HIT domain-containing protein [Anaerolineae bacterium]
MKRMWAPWRMEYLTDNREEGCIFCEKPAEKRDQENYLLYRGQTSYILLNLYPYSNGHLMVAPYQHVASLEDLEPEILTELMLLVNLSLRVLRRALKPHGFNVGVNIGKAAGAGFVDHVHIHIVPRWQGDTNFMPILAETRIIPELLDETYERLRAALQELGNVKT